MNWICFWRNALMDASRTSCSLPLCSAAAVLPSRASVFTSTSHMRTLLVNTIVCVSPQLATSRSSSDVLSASLHMTTRCVMSAAALPAEPIVTTTGERRYLRASRSTSGGIVALNMYVVRYTLLASSSSSSFAGFMLLDGIASSTALICGSKPRSIMRSASSSTT